nr:PIN domain-containing protein [Streptomyces jeddahensis]
MARGLVSICPPVESELMPGLRADRDYEPFFTMLGRTFGWVPALEEPWPKVIAVQRDLVKIGHHRGPSPMDILIALTAEQHRLTVLHVDDDFAAIAKVRPDISMLRLQPQTG